MTELRAELDSPLVRVCVRCGERWHSVRHYTDETTHCEQCELPLVETLATIVARVTSSDDVSLVRRFG